jgi:four helix bundle protein
MEVTKEQRIRVKGMGYIHSLIIAQGSANETEHWLRTAQDCELGPKQQIDEILKINNEIVRMITTAIGTLRGKLRTKGVAEEQTDYSIDSIE